MRIGVVGMGHVGLVTAACFARVGHHVVGVDIDAERIADLQRGSLPFFEPGLQELADEGLGSGHLSFSGDVADAVRGTAAIFICVGTPAKATGEADLSQVEHVAHQIAEHLDDAYKVIVEKSTVPVKTGQRLQTTLQRLGAQHVDVISNPEFLREGSAIADTLDPDRIVIGSRSEQATACLIDVYRPIIDRSDCAVVTTDVGSAELIKHASNAFLATKISFINAVADICEKAGADVTVIAQGMGLDHRINKAFLNAGVGYGGSCFPKDLAAFAALAEQLGCRFELLREVQKINEGGPLRIVSKLREELWHLAGKRIAVLGLAFKPGTDDLREAPALRVVDQLVEEGADLVAYDPVANKRAKEVLPSEVEYATSPLDAMDRADAAVFLTDWDEFRGLSPHAMKSALRFPIVVDGRNLFSLEEMRSAGMTYLAIGRPPLRP